MTANFVPLTFEKLVCVHVLEENYWENMCTDQHLKLKGYEVYNHMWLHTKELNYSDQSRTIQYLV